MARGQGQRIVIAGDYGDRYLLEPYNLYKFAKHNLRNISFEMVELLCADPSLRETFQQDDWFQSVLEKYDLEPIAASARRPSSNAGHYGGPPRSPGRTAIRCEGCQDLMRVVLDTNVLLSALLSPTGTPANIYNAWVDGRFTLLTCTEQLDELRAVLDKPKIAELIKPNRAGRLVNQLRRLAEAIDPLPRVERSSARRTIFFWRCARQGGPTIW